MTFNGNTDMSSSSSSSSTSNQKHQDEKKKFSIGIMCICGHDIGDYNGKYHCESETCNCRNFVLDKKLMLKEKKRITADVSADCYYKFRGLVIRKHRLEPGSISFEVERALRQYMGEQDLDIFMNDSKWQENNR